MTEQAYIQLAVEGDLDEIVLRKVIRHSSCPFEIYVCHGKKGKGFLRKRILQYANAAEKGAKPFIVLTDLDMQECAPLLVGEWLPSDYKRLLLRVAVREVEAWLMADGDNLARFLGITRSIIPQNPEDVENPKQVLINCARRSRTRGIHDDIVPYPETTSRIGKNYNGRLIEFVEGYWSIEDARQKAPSLDRALKSIHHFYDALSKRC